MTPLIEVPRYTDEELEIRSNDRYQYKPEMIISQNVALDQDLERNKEIMKLNHELNDLKGLKESLEEMKNGEIQNTLEEIRKSGLGISEDYQINYEKELFNPNSIEALLKHREELDQENNNNNYLHEKDTYSVAKEDFHLKNRKEKGVKNRLFELKNLYKDNLDEFIDDSEQSLG